MRVRDATGCGIIAGAVLGGIAYGWVKVEQQTQLTAQSWAWWIVILTTLLPLASYLQEKEIEVGALGGFINGLGTGLGVILLITSTI